MKIKVILGDITKLGSEVEAVVNAANEDLLGGGGVDGAIHQTAGPDLLKECYTLHGCEPGDAKVTKAYNLKQKYIIHTVGPRYYSNPNPAETLRSCYQKSLQIADKLGVKTIAFPSISTCIIICSRTRTTRSGTSTISRISGCWRRLRRCSSMWKRTIFCKHFTQ